MKQQLKKLMPWKRGTSFDKNQYLEIQTELLESIAQPEQLPLRFCFSYPSSSDLERDATLLKWIKGISVPDTEGKKVGKMLLDYISNQQKKFNCKKIAIINDTVASLIFAGLFITSANSRKSYTASLRRFRLGLAGKSTTPIRCSNTSFGFDSKIRSATVVPSRLFRWKLWMAVNADNFKWVNLCVL
ncbi:MAG: hypothetical protein GY866_09685 [Proteobacteria bacterium]|nr:hypothetical protein [Pseudomonadota bacterium]